MKFPLETLIHRLEREGFIIGIDTHLKIQTILRALGKDFTDQPESIKYILAPVIAHSQEGQQHFIKIFDEYYQQVILPSIDHHLSTEKASRTIDFLQVDPDVKKHVSPWRWLIPFIAMVILGGIALGLLLIQNISTDKLELEPVFEIRKADGSLVQSGDSVFVGEELRFQNRTLEIAERKLRRVGRPDELNAISFGWDFGNGMAEETFNNPRLRYQQEGLFLVTLTVRDSTTSPPFIRPTSRSIKVVCRQKPRLTRFSMTPLQPNVGEDVRIQVQTNPSKLRLRWEKNMQAQGSFEDEFTTFFTEEGQFSIRILGELEGEEGMGTCALLDTTFLVNIISNKQAIFLEAQKLTPDPGGEELVSFSYLLTLWPTLLLMLFVIITDYYFGQKRTERLLSGQRENFRLKKDGPFTLPFPDMNHLLSPDHRLYTLAKIMRQRSEGENIRLDIRKTIIETARALGMPQFHFLAASKASEYLILIEQTHNESHLTQLFNRLATLLKGEDVILEIFYFDKDHRICWNEDFQDGITLPQLKQRFARHRLIIYADGHHMIDPFSSAIAGWVPESMNIWNTRTVLITPVPVWDWGYKERLLSQHMAILPADIRCQPLIVDRLTSQQYLSFEDQKRILMQEFPETEEHLGNYDFNQAQDLRIYLSDPLYEWVAATMVYPIPNWQVTLAIGRVLSDRPGASFLLTYSNLLRIARIPWMQTGLRPTQLRMDLLDSLTPETEYMARKAVLDVLAHIRVADQSLAGHKLNIQLITNRFLTTPGDQEIAKKMYYLWKDEKLSDRALLNRMEKPSVNMNGASAADYLNMRFRGMNWFNAMAKAMLAAVIVGVSTFFLHWNYDQSSQLKEWDSQWDLHAWGLTKHETVVDSAAYFNAAGITAYESGKWLEARQALWNALLSKHQKLNKHVGTASSLAWTWEADKRYSINLDLSYSRLLSPEEIPSVEAFDQELFNTFSSKNAYLYINPEPFQHPLGKPEDYPDMGLFALHLLLNDYPVAGRNFVTVTQFNPATEWFNQLEYEKAYNEFYLSQLLSNEVDLPLHLESLHGMGLCDYYENRVAEALDIQNKIEQLSPNFFDREPPHLKSLLGGFIQDSLREAATQDSLLAQAREDSIRRERENETINETDLKTIIAKLDSLERLQQRLLDQLAYATYIRDSLKLRIDSLKIIEKNSLSQMNAYQTSVRQLRDSVSLYKQSYFEPVRQRLEKQPRIFGREVASLYERYKRLAYSRKTIPFQQKIPDSDPELKRIESQILNIIRKEYIRLNDKLNQEQQKMYELEKELKTNQDAPNRLLQSMTRNYDTAQKRISIINDQLDTIKKEKMLLGKSIPAAAN